MDIIRAGVHLLSATSRTFPAELRDKDYLPPPGAASQFTTWRDVGKPPEEDMTESDKAAWNFHENMRRHHPMSLGWTSKKTLQVPESFDQMLAAAPMLAVLLQHAQRILQAQV